VERDLERQRLSFGSVAELYDRARPSYPERLIDDVVAYAGTAAGAGLNAIEVGAGTGKATVLLAARGVSVLAIEPSDEMARIAQRRCQDFPSVTVQRSEFEHARFEPGAFDLLYSAQAWHWIDPQLRYHRARDALARAGALAAFWNRIDWRRCECVEDLAAAYESAGVQYDVYNATYPDPTADVVLEREWHEQIDAATGFEDAETRSYEWVWSYSADLYLELLGTMSTYLVLEPQRRESLFAEIAAAIERCGGTLDLTYESVLCLARPV
jgi:SAM-dependent methyltransferase